MIEGVDYRKVKYTGYNAACNQCDFKQGCKQNNGAKYIGLCFGGFVLKKVEKVNDENKTILNGDAKPKKDGTYIVIKQTPAGCFVGSNTPVPHYTLAEATKEAERLAKQVPDCGFVVMKAISVSKVITVKTINFEV